MNSLDKIQSLPDKAALQQLLAELSHRAANRKQLYRLHMALDERSEGEVGKGLICQKIAAGYQQLG